MAFLFCLYAKQENAAALALYKSLGFEARGEYLLGLSLKIVGKYGKIPSWKQ